jgi:hypothetical protein
MRHGSRLLFAIAVLLVLAALGQALSFAAASAGPYEHSSREWVPVLTTLLSAGSYAAMPLFAALLIHRLDQWLGSMIDGRNEPDRPDLREPSA